MLGKVGSGGGGGEEGGQSGQLSSIQTVAKVDSDGEGGRVPGTTFFHINAR